MTATADNLWWADTEKARNYFDTVKGTPGAAVEARRHLGGFFEKLRSGRATVAFLGGSITWGGNASDIDTWSYRARVTEWLKRGYPDSELVSINAGMGGTPSRLGVCRTGVQVVEEGADLCIVEFCVNDNKFNAPEYGTWIDENMEGIVRKCLRNGCDVAVLCVAHPDPAMPFARHQMVASHYGVPFVELNSHVHACIEKGLFKYDGDFAEGATNVHPNDFGHSVYAERIAADLAPHAERKPAEPAPLEEPMTANRFENVTMVGFGDDNVIDWGGWTFEHTSKYGPWLGNISTTKPYSSEWPFPFRAGRAHADAPGQTMKVTFTGRVFGLWGPGGNDRGIVTVTIDGKKVGEKDLYWGAAKEPFGPGGWEVFAIDLEEGEHEAEIAVSEKKNEESAGHDVALGFMFVEA